MVKSIRSLVDQLFKDYSLLKKLLYTAQDCLAIEAKLNSDRSRGVKIISSTYLITAELFKILRNSTLDTLKFSTNESEINYKERYVSLFPLEVFDEFLKHSSPSAYQLQVILQN